MTTEVIKRPWGVHVIGDIYAAGNSAEMPEGGWAIAVPEPYTGNRLVAAWWVLTGRAYALQWPKAGDLERGFITRSLGNKRTDTA